MQISACVRAEKCVCVCVRVELWGNSSELGAHSAELSTWVNVHSIRISKGSYHSICIFFLGGIVKTWDLEVLHSAILASYV